MWIRKTTSSSDFPNKELNTSTKIHLAFCAMVSELKSFGTVDQFWDLVDGDHSGCAKPAVDIDVKVAF